MKYLIFTMCLVAFVLASCSSSKSNSDVTFSVAQNYFVKNTVEDGLFELSIDSQEEFDSYFGMARVMGEDGIPTKIDFDSQFVIALILPVSDNVTSVDVERLAEQDQKLVLGYSVEQGDQQSFRSRHALILIVSKDFLKDLEFVKV